MCAYYEDETNKIKKEDLAIYQGQRVQILSVKHIRSDKTMDILYLVEDEERQLPVIPYHGKIENLKLIERVAHA